MRRKAKAAVALIGLGFVLAGMQGCYREVIDAKGIGADQSYPRRAQSSEPEIDKAIDNLFEDQKN